MCNTRVADDYATTLNMALVEEELDGRREEIEDIIAESNEVVSLSHVAAGWATSAGKYKMLTGDNPDLELGFLLPRLAIRGGMEALEAVETLLKDAEEDGWNWDDTMVMFMILFDTWMCIVYLSGLKVQAQKEEGEDEDILIVGVENMRAFKTALRELLLNFAATNGHLEDHEAAFRTACRDAVMEDDHTMENLKGALSLAKPGVLGALPWWLQ